MPSDFLAHPSSLGVYYCRNQDEANTVYIIVFELKINFEIWWAIDLYKGEYHYATVPLKHWNTTVPLKQ